MDPVSEAPENIELELVGTDPGVDPFFMLTLEIPDAEHDPLTASTPDMDGDLLVANRQKTQTITCTVRATGADAAALMPVGGTLQRAIGKHHAEGGTLAITPPDGDRVIFDVQDAEMDPSTGIDVGVGRTTVECRFHCLPGARGTEYLTDTVSSGGSPVCRATIPDIPGDLQALVRLIATEGAGSRQLSFMWGARQRFYDSAASAALYFEAEALTNHGTTADAARTGASGGNVARNTGLSTAWQSILSTQIGGGSHMSHVGSYRVRARVYDANATQGKIQLRLSWSEGDFSVWTDNATVEPPVAAGSFSIVDLGIIRLRKAKSGAQQWQGQVQARTLDTTLAQNDIDLDCLWLEPIDEGSGRLVVSTSIAPPSSYTASDRLVGSGALDGSALDIGGNWNLLGAVDGDFTRTADYAERTSTDDGATAVGDPYNYTEGMVTRGYVADVGVGACLAQVDFWISDATNLKCGHILRESSASDFTYLLLVLDSGGGGTMNTAVYIGQNASTPYLVTLALGFSTWYTLSVLLDASNHYKVWITAPDTPLGDPLDEGSTSANSSGKTGLFDTNTDTDPSTRRYRNYRLWVPAEDAAIFSSQSLEVRHDLAQREDSGGSIWVPRPDYQGDYCTVAPAGNEGRIAEVIAKASRGTLGQTADSAIDPLSLQFGITPRYRNVFTGLGIPSGFPAYSLTNVTTRMTYDANAVTLDALADFLATLIRDIPLPIGTYSVSNLATDRVFNANATTLNELADVIGTLASELALPGPHPTFAPSNVTIRRSMDCNNVSIDQLADVLGTFINDLISAGLL